MLILGGTSRVKHVVRRKWDKAQREFDVALCHGTYSERLFIQFGLGNGNDAVVGKDGDKITVGNGNDTASGGANCTIDLGNGKDAVTGGDSDTITAGSSRVVRCMRMVRLVHHPQHFRTASLHEAPHQRCR